MMRISLLLQHLTARGVCTDSARAVLQVVHLGQGHPHGFVLRPQLLLGPRCVQPGCMRVHGGLCRRRLQPPGMAAH